MKIEENIVGMLVSIAHQRQIEPSIDNALAAVWLLIKHGYGDANDALVDLVKSTKQEDK